MKLLAAIVVGAGVLALSTDARSQSQLPQIVQSGIDENRKACLPEKSELLPRFVTTRDINADGRPDYVLDYAKFKCGQDTTYFCGSAGCLTQVYASRPDGSYVQALDENVRRLRFAQLKGRPAMLLDLHGSACGKVGAAACTTTMIWNGSTFSAAR
jgi:hypothetical protein